MNPHYWHRKANFLPESIFFVDIIPHLADDRQIMGHFIAQDDAGNAIGKGLAGHDLDIYGFMVKMFTRDTERYIKHSNLACSWNCRTSARR
jgi:hypothetical protein